MIDIQLHLTNFGDIDRLQSPNIDEAYAYAMLNVLGRSELTVGATVLADDRTIAAIG